MTDLGGLAGLPAWTSVARRPGLWRVGISGWAVWFTWCFGIRAHPTHRQLLVVRLCTPCAGFCLPSSRPVAAATPVALKLAVVCILFLPPSYVTCASPVLLSELSVGATAGRAYTAASSLQRAIDMARRPRRWRVEHGAPLHCQIWHLRSEV
jgi:hypothetical protein